MTKSENCSEAKVGANTYVERYKYSLKIPNTLDHQWFYVVFKPLNVPYKDDRDWFRYKGLDKCRQKLGVHTRSVLTLEITDCAKCHVNALVYAPTGVFDLHNKVAYHKYKIYCVIINDHYDDRLKVLKYMFKEANWRKLALYKDYLIKLPQPRAEVPNGDLSAIRDVSEWYLKETKSEGIKGSPSPKRTT